MAYVALSRVRTFDGLHLVAFHPNSIMVSGSSLREVNRLRETYRSDLPLYTIPRDAKTRNKRKLSGSTRDHVPLAKKHAPSKPMNRKRNLSLGVENTPLAKMVSTDREEEPHASGSWGEIEFVREECVSPYRFNPVDERWQTNACTTLGLVSLGLTE